MKKTAVGSPSLNSFQTAAESSGDVAVTMNLGGMEAIAQQVAGKAILDHAKETEQKLVSLGSVNKRKPCREDPPCASTAVCCRYYSVHEAS